MGRYGRARLERSVEARARSTEGRQGRAHGRCQSDEPYDSEDFSNHQGQSLRWSCRHKSSSVSATSHRFVRYWALPSCRSRALPPSPQATRHAAKRASISDYGMCPVLRRTIIYNTLATSAVAAERGSHKTSDTRQRAGLHRDHGQACASVSQFPQTSEGIARAIFEVGCDQWFCA